MSDTNFIQQMCCTITRESLMTPGDAVVVAVSGGADSMALLHALDELNRDGTLPLRLHVAHLNHGLRGKQSGADAAFVADACQALNIPVTCDVVDVDRLVEQTGGSVEQRAREARYDFLKRVCQATDSRLIATAHHADDQAETIVHRIARGTGLRGLAGIAPKRPLAANTDLTIVRPLLTMRRQDILSFVTQRGITFRHDASNDDDRYTRNRIRRSILPAIEKEIHPQAVQAILRLGEQARWTYDFLHDTASEAFDDLILERRPSEVILDAGRLSAQPRIVQTEIIRLTLLCLRSGERDLSWSHLTRIADLAADAAKQKMLHAPGGIEIQKQNDRLHFRGNTSDAEPTALEQITVALPGQTPLPTVGLNLSATVEACDASSLSNWKRGKTKWQERFDLDRLRPPLMIRSRTPGDRFHPLGVSGTKKLSDFFIDEKVDANQRDRIPILCDQDGPVWVIPYRIDQRAGITKHTRTTLTLHAQPL